MDSQTIRSRYLDFFAARGHTVIPSAPLVPENDPTVLFTTAGMHPLVPYLLGTAHPSGKRLTSAQKCVRTGDIDEVGDNRHLTFFEMLGNWSLGDYFKEEAIQWSWEFLTDPEVGLGLDPTRLYVTVFAGDADAPRDETSITAWQARFAAAGIAAAVDRPLTEGGRIFAMPKDSNWWGPAGQTGPCGPDTEMYYDTGEVSGGSLIKADGWPDFDSGRLVEIWNDVFMQYEKQEDGSFTPLAQHNVDTGMGLERTAMVMQGARNVFETDLFQPLIAAVTAVTPALALPECERSRYIVADHVRSAVMLIADGVRPSNKDRGYVLRRLIRRAVLHSDCERTDWVEQAVAAVGEIFATAYPEVNTQKATIVEVIRDEAAKFQKTLKRGTEEIAKRERLTGKDAFDLYQTYGFPLELTREYATEKGVTIDEEEFEREFSRHRDLSRTASAGQFASGLADRSEETVRYHTATHLLHQALRSILGEHIAQRGSNITPERLRFDFSHPEKLSEAELAAVEEEVNARITEALPVSSETMTPEAALGSGAIGLFGHKYGESVSVYQVGGYSREICSGPHVQNTSELGRFRIVKEEAVSAGVRRIKAVLE